MEAKDKEKKAFPIKLDVLGSSTEIRHTCEFVKDKIVMGRILSADLRIDDPRVSRIHALLEIRDDRIVVTDLASTHGTFLNGEKIIEAEVKFGDVLRLGVVDLKVEKGSGKAHALPVPSSDGAFVSDGEQTRIDIEKKVADERREPAVDRRKRDAFPDERRLDDRRDGDRRIDQRKEQRRQSEPETTPPTGVDRREKSDRRTPLGFERRVGERRRSDRRVFDITSLERRIDERRKRKSDDDVLPEELERAFRMPDHARELEVTVLWGDHILDVSNYYEPNVITVGESPKNYYIIPSIGIPDEFPLLTIEEDGNALLAFTDDMTGTVRVRDKIYDVKELPNLKFVQRHGSYYKLPLRQDDFAKLRIGTVNFFILYVKPAPRIGAAPFFERDKLLLRTLISSALLMLLLMVGMSFIPEPQPMTIEMIPERFARIVITKRPKLKPPKTALPAKRTMKEGSKKAEGSKAPEKVGKPKPDKKKVAKKKKAPPKKKKVKAKVAKKKARPKRRRKVVDAEKAKSVGLLKAFNQSSVQKSLKGMTDKTPGADVFGKNYRATRGRHGTVFEGAGGQGLKSVNVGGGGKTIGIKGPSTKGLGAGGAGKGAGEGIYGTGRLGQKGEYSVSVLQENIQILSGLPKDVINAVVQRHRNEIRQCYEAARQGNPRLRGKIVATFNIKPNGIVSYAGIRESTVGDKGLERCIVSRIRTWRFPKPEAPVVTEVRAFPFYLNPGN